jgi:site-specific recombinase XerD
VSDVVTVPSRENLPALPPVLSGANTPEIKDAASKTSSIRSPAIFEAWVNRRKSDHTRRAYRGDVMAFVDSAGLPGRTIPPKLLRVSILDVQAFKDHMGKHGGAPKTINRRISSLPRSTSS